MKNFEEAFNRLDQFIEQEMQEANIPGIAVALTDREKVLWLSTYGFADVSTQAPVTPDTLFEIGSIGKSFTSIALLQLREEGQLDSSTEPSGRASGRGLKVLHEPITRYLPWFHVQSGYEPITLHHLMSHTAGMIRGTDFSTESRYEVWALRETEATAPPGTYFHYSNAGYKALGVLLEDLQGQPYGDIIQTRILDPLGMSASDPVITHETRQRLAVGYTAFYDDRPLPRGGPLAPATWFETATGDGCIASNPADMAIYLRMLMNRGQGPRGRILSEESFSLMTQHVIQPGDDWHAGFSGFYGYGLAIEECDGHTVIGHGGGMVGYRTQILADMDDGLGVVVLTNKHPAEPKEVALFALRLLRAALHDCELPELPPVTDPTRVENAADYTGTYRAGGKTFTLAAEEERLILRRGGSRIILEQRDSDQFYVNHPDLALFLLRFGRKEGQVVEAFHGPDWYVNERYEGPVAFDYPQEWDAYSGHYRSHNPWLSNFRVILRKGALALIVPSGEEEPLIPLGGGVFRVGEEKRCPERIHFDTALNGQTVHASLSCGDYYRTFTP